MAQKSNDVTVEQVDAALRYVAQLVLDQPKFMPIFRALEKGKAELIAEKEDMQRAIALAAV